MADVTLSDSDFVLIPKFVNIDPSEYFQICESDPVQTPQTINATEIHQYSIIK